MKDLVTVVVPVYNAETYLNNCLASLLKQTYKKLEIICINDGSKDNSLAILNEYAKNDKRIIIFDQKNIGAALTRNKGLLNATGKYVTFVDSDDWVEQDYIETLVNSFTDEYDIILSGYKKSIKGKTIINLPVKGRWDIFKYSATLGKLYRTSFLKLKENFYNKRLIMEDVEFNINCFINGARYKTINYAGYIYNINDTSVTSSSKDKSEQLGYAIELFENIDNKAKNTKGFNYEQYKDDLINFYVLHYMYIINMCCKKAKSKFMNKTTKRFIKFLINIDKKWYTIKNPENETKKNSFAIKLFKDMYRARMLSMFFCVYSLKNKIIKRR